ncbi:DDB1- and CUL4-associated factor 11 [Tribolium castaneum]|nr:PREDICTED: DDB1- and CUL4-associated factor 11 [Tribolium castaneum]|eukprot:XP_971729.2 PREDICTED: DDB1- and CUL4-associated factor 11 [Tribolium castaneum]
MGSYTSRRMEENDLNSRSGSEDDSDYETEHQYAALLQSLINSGQVEIMDADYLTDGPKVPKIKFKPNTSILDKSEFSLSTKMASGLGQQSRKITSSQNISDMVLNREKGVCSYRNFSYAEKCRLSNRFLPNSMSVLSFYNGKVFCGIFSKDGKMFITASQDRQIRLYKSDDASYKLFNTLSARDIGWSIIDVAISPDQNQFVYSTWSSSLHLCSVNESSHQEPLSLTNTSRRFCVFSVVFSSDGKEFLCGANDGSLYIYDLQRRGRTLKIPAHEYDVNSVAFADDSSHIIYSGGDDGLIKVWDRRTLDESSVKPVGKLAGHMDGITFIDSRGDGRHLISNSKDQSIKLWDVRIFSGERAAEKSLKAVHEQTWDYRWQQVPKRLFTSKDKLEGDTSIMTYRGHVVIKTLVRCRFSPVETTGQRFIYTGSGTGDLIIYDSLTGKIEEFVHGHKACVRDVAWHPYRNEILTSAWDGRVGRWTYVDKDALHQNACERNRRSNYGPKPQSALTPPRRSERLALKKQLMGAD